MTAPAHPAPSDVWTRLAEPVNPAAIKWRQDGKPNPRDGRFFARFVPYIEALTVSDRLDSVVPGWSLTIEVLPQAPNSDTVAVSASLSLGEPGSYATREDVGHGKDYKQASTDAFKRAAARFGIGRELYEMKSVSVEVDSDGKYAKPLQNPADVYASRTQSTAQSAAWRAPAPAPAPDKPYVSAEDAPDDRFPEDPPPPCPKCGGKMWDNRHGKRNPRAPDFKCRDRACDGVIWPPKEPKKTAPAAPAPAPVEEDDDELPF